MKCFIGLITVCVIIIIIYTLFNQNKDHFDL